MTQAPKKQHKNQFFRLLVFPVAPVLGVILIVLVFIINARRENPEFAYSPTLGQIIKNARSWGPAYQSWLGKMAPDFTLTDITGKQHKLSDYRGKDVMIIFWATWCRPCLIEMPHLIALRNTIGEDKLAMLAISNERPALVENFAAQKKINYTVFSSDPRAMPAPFSRIKGIPCSFFIGPEGKIKLATEGLLSLGEMKAILQADLQTQ